LHAYATKGNSAFSVNHLAVPIEMTGTSHLHIMVWF